MHHAGGHSPGWSSAALPEREWRRSPGSRPAPLVGITADITFPDGKPQSLRATCALTYARAVARAGGAPVILPPIVELIPEQVRRCDAFVLTGGDDPRTEPFGEPTHARAMLVHADRQAYETALLQALGATARARTPVLGVCLGMQMMALVAGGRLNQHLPDDTPTAAQHTGDRAHAIVLDETAEGAAQGAAARGFRLVPGEQLVTSHHHQAVRDPGRLRVLARAPDGVIEAIYDPARPFYLGVQWHPERTSAAALGDELFRSLVASARAGEDQGHSPGSSPPPRP